MNKQCGNGKSLYSMSLWHFIYRYLLCSDVNLKIYYSTEVWWYEYIGFCLLQALKKLKHCFHWRETDNFMMVFVQKYCLFIPKYSYMPLTVLPSSHNCGLYCALYSEHCTACIAKLFTYVLYTRVSRVNRHLMFAIKIYLLVLSTSKMSINR